MVPEANLKPQTDQHLFSVYEKKEVYRYRYNRNYPLVKRVWLFLARIFQVEMASINTNVHVEILFKRLTCKSDIQSPGSSIPHWAPLSASAQGYSRPSDAPQAMASLRPPLRPRDFSVLPSQGKSHGTGSWHGMAPVGLKIASNMAWNSGGMA